MLMTPHASSASLILSRAIAAVDLHVGAWLVQPCLVTTNKRGSCYPSSNPNT